MKVYTELPFSVNSYFSQITRSIFVQNNRVHLISQPPEERLIGYLSIRLKQVGKTATMMSTSFGGFRMKAPRNQNQIIRWLRYGLCGTLIGAGAILPGVSGGVLAVIFDKIGRAHV